MSETLKATPRVKFIQRAALVLLILAAMVNYMDRATLAVANPLIRQDLGLSIADMGYLLSAFLWAYAIAQLPGGAMVDKLGPRVLLALAMTLWSCAQFLGGLVQGFGQFFGARALLGIGEAPQFPACARVVRDWFNQRERGLPTGITTNAAPYLGSAVAVPLLTILMLAFGWRTMFMGMGIAGLVVAVAWYFVYRDPTQVALTAEENTYRTEGDPASPAAKVTFREWKLLFRFRTTWAMILSNCGCTYMLWIYNAWLPGYLEIERHMSVRYTGWAAAIPLAWGMLGGILGGYVCDILLRRGVAPVNSRKYPAAISVLGAAACTLGAAYVTSNAMAIVFISGALFLLSFTGSCAWSAASVVAPANCTASIGSMMNFGGYLAAAMAPAVTGVIVQATGSFVPALLVGALIGVAGAASWVFILAEPITAMDMDVISPPAATHPQVR
jgi:sugar phosphate permease